MAQIAKQLAFKVFESKFNAGQQINTIKASMRNIVNASTVCKWYRAACDVITKHRVGLNVISVKMSHLTKCVEVVKNTTIGKMSQFKAGTVLWMSHVDELSEIHGFKVVIL